RRQRSLGPELALETRVVEHHDPALGVGREARAAEQMVETDDDRCQALVSREPIDAVAVLLSEEEISRPRIDGEAAQGGLARSLREGDDDSRRDGRVHGKRAPGIEPEDLRRGIAAPAVAQDDQTPRRRERELGGPRNAGGHDLEPEPAGDLRSEEHTSELQSRFDLVCRLLLEKKKSVANWVTILSHSLF